MFSRREILLGTLAMVTLGGKVGGAAIVMMGQPNFDVTQRNPRPSDDTAHGYTVGDFWLNKRSGVLFKATGVSAGSASWQNLGSDLTPIVDRVGTAAGAYGVIKLVASYSGSTFRVQRASDNAQTDIGFVNGVADWSAVDAFLESTTGAVAKWYDQSGNGLDLAQSTFANMPQLVGNTVGALRSITFDAAQSKVRSMSNTSMSLGRTGMSAFIIGQVTTSGAIPTGDALFEFGAPDLTFYTYPNSPINLVANDGSAGNTGLKLDTGPALIGAISSASAINAYSNRSSGTRTASTSKTMTGVLLGNTARASSFQGAFEVLAFVVYNRALSSTELDTLKAASYQQFGITPQLLDTSVFQGDSITAGAGAEFNRSFARQAVPSLRRPSRYINMGVSGRTLAQMSSDYAGSIAPLYASGHRNTLFIFGGTNDIVVSGTDPTIAYSTLVTLAQAAKTTGFKVVVATMLPRGSSFETARTAFNGLIRANWPTFADALADFAADPTMGAAGANIAPYYADGIHPTALGASIVAPIAAVAINSIG